jgi:hypothetical protein
MAMRARTLLIVAALSGVAFSGAGCGNEAPLFPTYHNDIKPIMAAHCIRCHGAGGTMNMDPDIPVIMPSKNQTPVLGDFTSLAGLMPFTGPNGGTLKQKIDILPMPPPPSTALDSYDYDTIVTWASTPLP